MPFKVVAMFPFTKRLKDELTFEKGDHLDILNTRNSNWWMVSRKGREGYIPSQYVAKVGSLEAEP